MTSFFLPWALAACETPPLLSSVTDRLGADVAESAEIPARTLAAVGSLVAETCGVDDVSRYSFVGGGASALGATTATVSTGANGEHAWTFADAGIAEKGTLAISPDADRRTFAYTWEGTSTAFSGTLKSEPCRPDDAEDTGGDSGGDPGAPSPYAVVSGGGTWSGNGSSTVTLLGAAPDAGLGWSPPASRVPTQGWLRWTDARTEETVTLQDASGISGDRWPGTARGEGWSAAISLPVP